MEGNMTKLTFKYGTIGYKSTENAISFIKKQSKKSVLFLKPNVKNKYDNIGLNGEETVKSHLFSTKDDLFEIFENETEDKDVDIVVVDNTHYCTSNQIEQLRRLTANTQIFCYGLKTNFEANLFEGSKRLLELADNIEEIETKCQCGEKAVMNAHFINKFLSFKTEEAEGESHKFAGLCYSCFKTELYKTKINHKIVKYLEIFKDLDTAGDWSSDTPMDNVILQEPFVIYDEDVRSFVEDFREFEINHPEKIIVIADNIQALKKIPVKDQSFDYILSLISYVLKMEKIRPGLLKELIEDGTIVKWLKQVRKIIST